MITLLIILLHIIQGALAAAFCVIHDILQVRYKDEEFNIVLPFIIFFVCTIPIIGTFLLLCIIGSVLSILYDIFLKLRVAVLSNKITQNIRNFGRPS